MPEEVQLRIVTDRRWQRLHIFHLSACIFLETIIHHTGRHTFQRTSSHLNNVKKQKLLDCQRGGCTCCFITSANVETQSDFLILKYWNFHFHIRKKQIQGKWILFFSLIWKQIFKDSNHSTIPALWLCFSKPSHSCVSGSYTGLMHELCKERKAEASWVDILILTVY